MKAALPIKIIIIIVVAVLVVTVFFAFISAQTTPAMTTARANEIYHGVCNAYKENDCAWEVTRTAEFQEFLDACIMLFGDENTAFSCLYEFCCVTSEDAKCDGLCSICVANHFQGMADTMEACCQNFKSECPEATCSRCVSYF